MALIGRNDSAQFTAHLQQFLFKARDAKVTGIDLIDQFRFFARGERGKGRLWVEARMHLPRPNAYPHQWKRMLDFIEEHVQSGQTGVVVATLQQVGRGEPVSLFK